jgi:hypothetical protein
VIRNQYFGGDRKAQVVEHIDAMTADHGTAPIEVSSGQRKVYRLSRRGNRRLNHAIHMAAITQICHRHSQGRAYYDKKRARWLRRSRTPACPVCSRPVMRGHRGRWEPVSDPMPGRLARWLRRSRKPAATGSSRPAGGLVIVGVVAGAIAWAGRLAVAGLRGNGAGRRGSR